MTSRSAAIAVAAFALASAGAAWAGPGHADHADHAAPAAYGAPGEPSAVSRTIVLKALDVAFDASEIRVRAGETVRFVVVNEGALVHELTLGDQAAQSQHRERMAVMSEDEVLSSDHHHPNAVSVAAGAQAELVWRFGGPGRFEFACNVLGHAESGMAGVLIVE